MPKPLYPPIPKRRSEKAWGYEQFIAVEPEYIAKIVVMHPSTEMHWHLHSVRHESIFCATGSCEVEAFGRPSLPLRPGMALSIFPRTMHRIHAGREGVRLFEVSTPQPDDVKRFEHTPENVTQPETTIHELHVEAREKPWGREMIIASTPWYTAKLVYLDKEKSTSRHFHVQRKETLHFLSPNCSLQIGDGELLQPGAEESITIYPGKEHRLTGGINGGRVFEVSAFDPEQTDVVRTSDPWRTVR
jgi:quercetin dioxygenase-like cupin family protein